MIPIARLYHDAQDSIVELFESLDEDEWATVVPCSPEWTVRDVLSHLVGVTDDITNRRLEGAATEAWTAAQIERWSGADPAVLIAMWRGQIGDVAGLLQAIGELRPAFDAHMHEHDIRHALGRPGARSQEIIDHTIAAFANAATTQPVEVTFEDGTTHSIPGEGDALALDGIARFEFLRSRLGRRTPEQVRAYPWSASPDDALLESWFIFGPTTTDIVE